MASAQLTRTPSSASNRRTWTWSGWIKRSKLGSGNQVLFEGIQGGFPEKLQFTADDLLEYDHDIAGTDYTVNTVAAYRDVNAWYHIVWAKDTTQATETDRIKLYVNGTQISLSESQLGYPGQNYEGAINNNVAHYIGANNGSEYFDGQMAHVHFVDGTALAPTAFGETDATTGIWKPKTAPSVTYGTNGYFLKMDNSANMGLDSGGGSNNFTTSGTIIQTKDTPSNVFCTNNRLWKQESARYANLSKINGLISGAGSSTWYQLPGTLGFTKGKYYWECKFSAGTNLDKNTAGVIDYAKTQEDGQFQDKTGSVFYKNEDGGETRIDGSTSSADYGTLAQNDILGVAVDMDAATPTVKFYKNGSLLVTASAASLAGKTVTPAQTVYTSGEYSVNYGNGYFGTTAVSSAENPDDGVGIFEHDVPAGYRALCTKSLNAQEYS